MERRKFHFIKFMGHNTISGLEISLIIGVVDKAGIYIHYSDYTHRNAFFNSS